MAISNKTIEKHLIDKWKYNIKVMSSKKELCSVCNKEHVVYKICMMIPSVLKDIPYEYPSHAWYCTEMDIQVTNEEQLSKDNKLHKDIWQAAFKNAQLLKENTKEE